MANQAEFLNNFVNLINFNEQSRNQGYDQNYPRFDCEIPVENQLQGVMRSNPGLTISVVNEAKQPQPKKQGYEQNCPARVETYPNQINSAIQRIESDTIG